MYVTCFCWSSKLRTSDKVDFSRSCSAAKVGDKDANHEDKINTLYFKSCEVFFTWSCVRWNGIGVYCNSDFAVFHITDVCFSGKAVPRLAEWSHSACVMSESCLLEVVWGPQATLPEVLHSAHQHFCFLLSHCSFCFKDQRF